MTKETILDNCNRLFLFMKQDGYRVFHIDELDISGLGLLKWYSRYLDFFGCPKYGASILFLPDKKEYEELREHASLNFCNFSESGPNKEIPGAIVMQSAVFFFDYNGYYWQVENR